MVTKKFKSFDKVLVKRSADVYWSCDLYSHLKDSGTHETLNKFDLTDEEILPYEGNEFLVGTTDNPDEEVRLEEFELLICNHETESFIGRYGRLCHFVRLDGDCFEVEDADTYDMTFKYAIRFSDFNPNDMEATKAKILCVKNGRIIRYKG